MLRIHTDLTERHRTLYESFLAGLKHCHGAVYDGDRTDTDVICGNSVPASAGSVSGQMQVEVLCHSCKFSARQKLAFAVPFCDLKIQ